MVMNHGSKTNQHRFSLRKSNPAMGENGTDPNFGYFAIKSLHQWIGLRENLLQSPIFNEIYGLP